MNVELRELLKTFKHIAKTLDRIEQKMPTPMVEESHDSEGSSSDAYDRKE